VQTINLLTRIPIHDSGPMGPGLRQRKPAGHRAADLPKYSALPTPGTDRRARQQRVVEVVRRVCALSLSAQEASDPHWRPEPAVANQFSANQLAQRRVELLEMGPVAGRCPTIGAG